MQTVVSVAGMAKLVGLSRQRFHQLMTEGVFPSPVYDIRTRRPHYTEEMQRSAWRLGKKRRHQRSGGAFLCPSSRYAHPKKTNQTPRVRFAHENPQTRWADRGLEGTWVGDRHRAAN